MSGRSALSASLILGVFHAIWHLIRLEVVFVAMAVMLPVLYGRDLSHKPETTPVRRVAEQPAAVK